MEELGEIWVSLLAGVTSVALIQAGYAKSNVWSVYKEFRSQYPAPNDKDIRKLEQEVAMILWMRLWTAPGPPTRRQP